MATTAIPQASSPPRNPTRPLSGFADVLRSEFCKLRSVRSTLWILVATVACDVVVAAVIAAFVPTRLSSQEKPTLDPVRVSLGGLHISQITVGALGVLIITSEYGTGMIRATLAAVPRRRVVLAAKATVLTTTALLVGTVASFAAYFAFQAFRSGDSLKTSLGDPGVLRAVFGGGLYVTILGLLGLGLGAVIRSSAGSIAALFSLLFVPPLLTDLLPQSWQTTITPYVPMEAGGEVFIAVQRGAGLSAWTGFGVLCLYAVVALATGFLLINHRDA